MYDMKALYEARSVQDAVRLLTEHPQAIIIAGGSDVLIKMREGKLAGCELVSIYGIDALRGIFMDADGTLRILPLTSFSHITRDSLIQKHIAVLGEAVDQVGGPQIRNIGTIGGNTCNGVTSADSASTLFAWDAVMEITGPQGVRQVPIQQFYIKPGRWHCSTTSWKRPFSSKKRAMRATGGITSSMPCATPWILPPAAAP